MRCGRRRWHGVSLWCPQRHLAPCRLRHRRTGCTLHVRIERAYHSKPRRELGWRVRGDAILSIHVVLLCPSGHRYFHILLRRCVPSVLSRCNDGLRLAATGCKAPMGVNPMTHFRDGDGAISGAIHSLKGFESTWSDHRIPQLACASRKLLERHEVFTMADGVVVTFTVMDLAPGIPGAEKVDAPQAIPLQQPSQLLLQPPGAPTLLACIQGGLNLRLKGLV